MNKHRVRNLVVVAALALGVALMAVTASGAGQERADPRTQREGRQGQAPQPAYTRAQAQAVAGRLYRAILGREADPAGLAGAVSELERGNLRGQITNMLRSPEFEQKAQERNATQLLEQFYQGLLGRQPDSAGVTAFTPKMRVRQYASVLMEMVGSPEFQQAVTGGSGGSGQPTAAPSRLEAALDCQARVLDRLRRDSAGRPFVSFDRLPDVSADGKTVRGQAVDRFDADRDMAYACEGTNVSYTYRDGRQARGGDRKMQFPSVAVKNCQVAVSPSAVFDAASLTITDTATEYVLGWIGGTRYTCETQQQRVLSLKSK